MVSEILILRGGTGQELFNTPLSFLMYIWRGQAFHLLAVARSKHTDTVMKKVVVFLRAYFRVVLRETTRINRYYTSVFKEIKIK